ncbi:unnamed protein product [Rotaria magnacalcarata]|uniref:Uncharacterized protein n=1 Tax=Rotaria magnacalcarata TaxID=392030 RepID=A0A816TGA5_9BILA|nr:unnamed protein product [Rotaria magnacalcarata]
MEIGIIFLWFRVSIKISVYGFVRFSFVEWVGSNDEQSNNLKLHSRIYQEESICKCVFSSINSNNVISFQIRCNLQSSDDVLYLT